MIDVGIVVLGWNRSDVTKNFFMSYIEHTPHDKARLVFIDNGSADNTTEIANLFVNKKHKIDVIKNSRNKGVAAGWNQGIRHLLNDKDIKYFIVINNDVLFKSNKWVDSIIDSVRNNKYILAGPQYVTVNSVAEVDGQMVNYIGGWCMGFHRDIIADVGYFNDDFYPAFYEDVEFSFRATSNGYRLHRLNDIPVEHISGESHNKVLTGNVLSNIHAKNQPIFKEVVRRFRKNPLVIFMCNELNHNWHDEDFEGKGVGGAEASLICLSRELAKDGYRVDVVNRIIKEEAVNDRLQYHSIVTYKNLECDYYVQYRKATRFTQSVDAKVKLFWSTDQYTDGGSLSRSKKTWEQDVFPYIDAFCCISQFHMDYIKDNFDLNGVHLYFQELGIKEEDYWSMPEKDNNKMIFCSVPHRGLAYLLDAWVDISTRIPEVELYITSDYRLWGGRPDNDMYVKFINKIEDKGIRNIFGEWKVSRERLVELQLNASFMTYPSIYDENFCISAMECQAAGAIPVTTKTGALATTVNKYSGVQLNKFAKTDKNGLYVEDEKFTGLYVDALYDIVNDRARADKLRAYGRNRAMTRYSWKTIEKQWSKKFVEIAANK